MNDKITIKIEVWRCVALIFFSFIGVFTSFRWLVDRFGELL